MKMVLIIIAAIVLLAVGMADMSDRFGVREVSAAPADCACTALREQNRILKKIVRQLERMNNASQK